MLLPSARTPFMSAAKPSLCASPTKHHLRNALRHIPVNPPDANRIFARIHLYNMPFTVQPGDTILTNRIKELAPGQLIQLDRIKAVGGADWLVTGPVPSKWLDPLMVRVEGCVVEHGRSQKYRVDVHKQRKGRRPKKMMKPHFTRILIRSIQLDKVRDYSKNHPENEATGQQQ